MMQSRTHTCGELRIGDVGKHVVIAGWLENMRIVSANLAFVVVRDFYGTTQVVAETEEMMKTFRDITGSAPPRTRSRQPGRSRSSRIP